MGSVTSWTGQMRRSWGGNRTYSSSGFGSVSSYYMDGNSNRTVVSFPLLKPARSTTVKVTARYTSYRSFSDGTPKTAEFSIAPGQTVWGGAGNVFYTPNRKGDQFSMTNDVIRMPAYDSSPNLTSMQVEYMGETTVSVACPPPPPPPPPSSCTLNGTPLANGQKIFTGYYESNFADNCVNQTCDRIAIYARCDAGQLVCGRIQMANPTPCSGAALSTKPSTCSDGQSALCFGKNGRSL
jgi:hypothetical protein